MQKNYLAIKAAGADLIAISSDGEPATQQNVQNQGLTFVVLADPDVTTIADYNVVDPANKRIARPASYVLKKDGTIAWKSLEGVAMRTPTAQILTELGKLQ